MLKASHGKWFHAVLNLLVGCLLRDFWLPTVAGFSANRYGR